tara:strand:- start:535 stop:1242 length:708 start_codon:yes stop_codon:yes gene_type:complete
MPSNARWEKLNVQGSDMEVFVDEPSESGPYPTIVVAHHRTGLDAATTRFVQDLAGSGYVAAAPHLHHRRPSGEDTRESIKNLDDNEILNDLNATVSLLQGLESVDGDRMGIVGHCMGGRVSFLGAAEIGAFKCNVAYYSGNMFKVLGSGHVSPFDRLVKLRGATLAFFGNDDENPSPADVDKIDERLKELDIDHEFHRYDGCGHAFQNFHNPQGYRAAATADSMKKMFKWLDKRL